MPDRPVALRVRVRVPVRAALAEPWSVVDPLPDPSGDAATGSRTSVLSDTDWSFLIDEGAAGARPRSFQWCYGCGSGVPVRRAGAASRRGGRLGESLGCRPSWSAPC